MRPSTPSTTKEEGSVALTDVVQAYVMRRAIPKCWPGRAQGKRRNASSWRPAEVDGDRASLQNFREYARTFSRPSTTMLCSRRSCWRVAAIAEKQSPRGVHRVTHRDGRQSVEVLSEDGDGPALQASRRRRR